MPKRTEQQEPTLAPSMDRTQTLEGEASRKEKKRGESTEVTMLQLDRTPDE